MDPEVVVLLSGVSANHAEWGSAHSRSSAVFLVFARYEPLVSCSSCSLFDVGAMLGSTQDTCSASPDSMVQFLGSSSTCPLVCKRQGFGQTVEKTVVPQLHSYDKWSMSLVCGLCRFSGASVEETVVSVENSVVIPRVFLDKVIDMPLLCNDRCLVSGSAVAVH